MIDPLLRGIYYLYLDKTEIRSDWKAYCALVRVWHAHGLGDDWRSSICSMSIDRAIFVKELMERNG